MIWYWLCLLFSRRVITVTLKNGTKVRYLRRKEVSFMEVRQDFIDWMSSPHRPIKLGSYAVVWSDEILSVEIH